MNRIPTYYEIAKEEYKYLDYIKEIPICNPTVLLCQQLLEKALRHLIREFCKEDIYTMDVLESHSLKRLNEYLNGYEISLGIDRHKLKRLGDYYYDIRFPNDNFEFISIEDKDEMIAFTKEVWEKINKLLEDKGRCFHCGSDKRNKDVCPCCGIKSE